MAFILFVGGIVIGAGLGWLSWGSHLPELKCQVRRQMLLRKEMTASREPEKLALSRAEVRLATVQVELDAATAQIEQARDEHWELRCRLALAEAASESGVRQAGAPEDGAPEDGAPEDGAPEDGAGERALREELAVAQQASAGELARHRTTEVELEVVRAERDTEAGQVAALRAELAAAVAAPDDAPVQNGGRPAAVEPRRKRIAEVFRTVQSDATPGDDTDDLTTINGIGPVLGQKLRGLGITTFRQIAALSAADVARVDAELNFKGRIGRERWIEQARGILRSR